MARLPSSVSSFLLLLFLSLSLPFMQPSVAYISTPVEFYDIMEKYYRSPCGYYLYPWLGSLIQNQTVRVLARPPLVADVLRDGYEEDRAKRCLLLERRRSALLSRRYLPGSKRANAGQAEADALTNCLALSELSIRLLEEVSGEYKAAEPIGMDEEEYVWPNVKPRTQLSEEVAARTRSLMGRVAANQQSCFEGLAKAKFGSVAAALRFVKDEL